MADVSVSINASISKGFLSDQIVYSGVTSDMASAGMFSTTLELGTATSQVTTSQIGTLGLCVARSLATTTTHTISFGRLDGTTLHDSVRLKAGEVALLRLAPGDYAASAAVQGSRLLLQILED